MADRSQRLLARAALLALAFVAILHIPPSALSTLWLGAFVVPGLVLGAVSERVTRSRGLRAFVVLQISFAGLAWFVSGPPDPVAAMLITLLPLLAWAAARAHMVDVPLILALSFCVTLIGITLREAWSIWALAALGIAGAIVLVLEREWKLQEGKHVRVFGRVRPRGLVLASVVVALAFASLSVASTRSLIALGRIVDFDAEPEKDRKNRAKSGSKRGKRTGLSEGFFLERLGERDIQTNTTPLCFLEVDVGHPLPTDTYLRVGAFDTPAPRQWLREREPPVVLRHVRLPRVGAVRYATLHGLASLERFVPVPPGLVEARGATPLSLEPRAVLVRRLEDGPFTIKLQFASRMPLPTRLRTDDPRLSAIPDAYRIEEFERLVAELPQSASIAETLAAVRELLATRYSYVLSDPEGIYSRPILNFLFEAKRGYCMHFAGAATLLLRARGVPCRVASGLFRGSVGDEARAIEAEGARAITWMRGPEMRRAFGAQHAHAWVELPRLDGAWQVFDPTPQQYRGLAQARELAADEALAKQEAEDSARRWNIPWVTFLLVLLVVGLRFFVFRRIETAGVARTHALDGPTRSLFDALLAHLESAGLVRAPDESLSAFGRRLEIDPRVHDGETDAILDALLAYREVRYGGLPADADRMHRIERGTLSARTVAAIQRAA